MALLGIIGLIVLLVALRLLLPPGPQLVSMARVLGARTALVLFSVAMAGAAAIIVFSRR